MSRPQPVPLGTTSTSPDPVALLGTVTDSGKGENAASPMCSWESADTEAGTEAGPPCEDPRAIEEEAPCNGGRRSPRAMSDTEESSELRAGSEQKGDPSAKIKEKHHCAKTRPAGV